MLVLFQPEMYSLRAPPLRICGWPIPHALLLPGSSQGKFRTNVLEGLLNHWQHMPHMRADREALLLQWVNMHTTLHTLGWLQPGQYMADDDVRQILRLVPPQLLGARVRSVFGHMV